MSTNIETELKELLLEIKSDVKDLKKDVSELKTDTAVLKANQDNMKEQLSRIDGTQKAQIWALIVAVFGIVGLLAVALFKMN